MTFIKNNKVNLGRKYSTEHRRNISAALTGKKMSAEARKSMSEGQKGKKHSDATRLKMSLSKKGKIPKNILRGDFTGEKSFNWKGGITPINKAIRASPEYRLWRVAVFQRDNWTCVWCKARGVELHADHIKQFAFYPELRFAIDNGRTLCKPCHMTTETYKAKTKI